MEEGKKQQKGLRQSRCGARRGSGCLRSSWHFVAGAADLQPAPPSFPELELTWHCLHRAQRQVWAPLGFLLLWHEKGRV